MNDLPKPDTYRQVIDALVRMCKDGQGDVGARRARAGLWNPNATPDTLPEEHQANMLLGRLSTSERTLLAALLSEQVVVGVFETLKALEDFSIPPFVGGYEGGPYHDFIGRLGGWQWPKSAN